jgi:hypothetical protein
MEANEAMGALFQAEPQLFMMMGDLYLKNQDWPGAQEMAERMKKMLPPQLQDQGAQPNAQQLQQQLAQATAQIQQMKPLADANAAKLQQAQLDAQTQQQIAAAQLASQEKIAQFEAETKRQIEEIKAETERQKARASGMASTQTAAMKAQADVQTTVIAESAEDERARQQREHDAAAHLVDLQQQADMAHTAHQQNMEAADANHAHAKALQAAKPKGTA